MRLGLIGTGKQGQRYLLEKNGGRHITVSGSRRIPLDSVDGVIIATHPAGHKELALEAIAAGKAVLIEKPLALNLADCEAIIDAAEKAGVIFEVAHTHFWSEAWMDMVHSSMPMGEVARDAAIVAGVTENTRDYSLWLDWGPHLLAMALDLFPDADAAFLRSKVSLFPSRHRFICASARNSDGDHLGYLADSTEDPAPMLRMVESVFGKGAESYNFNRRVYRALFAE